MSDGHQSHLQIDIATSSDAWVHRYVDNSKQENGCTLTDTATDDDNDCKLSAMTDESFAKLILMD